jgi:hypothetical protein
MMNYLLVALLALALGTVLGILFLRARESALRSRLAGLETDLSANWKRSRVTNNAPSRKLRCSTSACIRNATARRKSSIC